VCMCVCVYIYICICVCVFVYVGMCDVCVRCVFCVKVCWGMCVGWMYMLRGVGCVWCMTICGVHVHVYVGGCSEYMWGVCVHARSGGWTGRDGDREVECVCACTQMPSSSTLGEPCLLMGRKEKSLFCFADSSCHLN
jgi:hypothetical protein